MVKSAETHSHTLSHTHTHTHTHTTCTGISSEMYVVCCWSADKADECVFLTRMTLHICFNIIFEEQFRFRFLQLAGLVMCRAAVVCVFISYAVNQRCWSNTSDAVLFYICWLAVAEESTHWTWWQTTHTHTHAHTEMIKVTLLQCVVSAAPESTNTHSHIFMIQLIFVWKCISFQYWFSSVQ